jgi:uroporphyrinogen-III synthase
MIYILSNKTIKGAKTLNLLNIEFKKISINFDKYDAFIFTSRNGVESVKNYIHSKECYAIGEATKEQILKYGGVVKLTSSKYYASNFAKELKELLKDKKSLYIRPKKVVSNLKESLSELDIDEIITYETSCNKTSYELDKNATIIFSSPSTIKCFFKNFKWQDSYKAVAIGDVTAKYIPNYIEYKVAKEPTLKSAIEKANE